MNPHADQSRKVSLTRSAITTVCIHSTSVLPRWTILVRLCISCKSRNMLMTTQRSRIHFFPKCETKFRTFCHVRREFTVHKLPLFESIACESTFYILSYEPMSSNYSQQNGEGIVSSTGVKLYATFPSQILEENATEKESEDSSCFSKRFVSFD
jgi:hypothetical protein